MMQVARAYRARSAPANHSRHLKLVLDNFVELQDRSALRSGDPVQLVHQYGGADDREVAGLIVALLAYGRVEAIKSTAAGVLEALGPHPARTLDESEQPLLPDFVYRFQKGDDLSRLLGALRRVRQEYGTLGAAFASCDEAGPHYAPAMIKFSDLLEARLEGPSTYGLRFLIPNPKTGGAAKRMCLFLRWMIRPEDGADLGTWRRYGLTPAKLIIPLDTHITRLAQYLGLTTRKTPNLKMALEVTDVLRGFRADDPLAYDMALCHLGISGKCPRQRDTQKCERCPINAVCQLGPTPKGWHRYLPEAGRLES